MENASKALIIAGAILLAILIISLGIMIYNQAAGVVNNNAMNEVEIASFNQKFMQYEGENVKGAQVNSLLNQVIQNNVSSAQEDSSKMVKVSVTNAGAHGGCAVGNSNWSGTIPNGSAAQTQSTNLGKALTGKTYRVVCTTDNQTGLVNSIAITAK